jgi:hypothetical protein
VESAVATRGGEFACLIALGAEVEWTGRSPRVISAAVEWELLASLHKPVGIALRIGGYAGPFGETGEPIATLAGAARKLIAQAKAAGVAPAELQIDFDCPQSKLAGYRQWLAAFRKAVAPVPLTVTALPSWLHGAGARPLLEATDGFVLQVHSLQRPAGIEALPPLCDPSAARRAVEEAAGMGRPFWVALPTYGYRVAFDANGRYLGLSAEGYEPHRPAGVRTAEVSADPAALAELVRDWTADRAANMAGVIWYRLPSRSDEMNWRWATLREVMAGREPAPRLRAEASSAPGPKGLAEVTLVNDGTGDSRLDIAVEVCWNNSRLVSADAIGGFERAPDAATSSAGGPGRIVLKGPGPAARLRAGDRLKIGWIRLSENREVAAHVITGGS